MITDIVKKYSIAKWVINGYGSGDGYGSGYGYGYGYKLFTRIL